MATDLDRLTGPDRRTVGLAAVPWTLALIVAGLTLGCFNAWHWIAKEDKAMREEREHGDE